MKKFLAMLLTAALCVSLAACGESPVEKTEAPTTTAATTEAATTTTEEATTTTEETTTAEPTLASGTKIDLTLDNYLDYFEWQVLEGEKGWMGEGVTGRINQLVLKPGYTIDEDEIDKDPDLRPKFYYTGFDFVSVTKNPQGDEAEIKDPWSMPEGKWNYYIENSTEPQPNWPAVSYTYTDGRVIDYDYEDEATYFDRMNYYGYTDENGKFDKLEITDVTGCVFVE